MHNSAELLIRSAVHDLANVLGGIRGIIDLNSADQPLTGRDRERLEAVIEEGLVTLERTRNLATGALPDATPMPAPLWRSLLLEQLQPMGVIFRCRFELSHEPSQEAELWPGERLHGYVRAVTRQVLPHVQDGQLKLHCDCDPREWRVRWHSGTGIPDQLLPTAETTPQDLGSRWAARVGGALAITLSWEDGALLARIPRP